MTQTAAARATAVALLVVPAAFAAPADRMPAPQPERCLGFVADVAEGEMASPEGLTYAQVAPPLRAALQHAAHCPQPAGMREIHLTFELVVGCDGLVADVAASDDGGAPQPYVTCVADVLRKADFPAHDVRDGFPVTYPVDVRW